MTQETATPCPHCGQPLDGVPDGPEVRCRSCAAIVAVSRDDAAPPGKTRHSGYVIAVLLSALICMLLIISLVAVTLVNLLRG